MGGWSSLKLVERYAHLIGSEHREAIETFFRVDVTISVTTPAASRETPGKLP
jgi:hypothetical protein